MQRSRCFALRWLFAISALLFSLPLTAQAPALRIQEQHQQERFVKQEVMIPMRDGVRLETVIFTPKQSSGRLPILLRRTPYDVPESERGLDSRIYEDLIADGYIFVSQDIFAAALSRKGRLSCSVRRATKASPTQSMRAPTPTTPSIG